MTAEAGASEIDELLRSTHRALVARAFVELALPDHLGDTPKGGAQLAEAMRADPATLTRLLRAATATGLCVDLDGHFVLTDAGKQLRSGAPGNAAGWLLLTTAPWTSRAWEQLAEAVRSGLPSFPRVHGQTFWDYVAEHPDQAGVFDQTMTSGAIARADDLLDALDWAAVDVVVDVGGGQGLLAAQLLARHGHLRGVVADTAEVVASPAAAAVEMGPRLDLVATDFFTGVPGGGDVYVLSRILHDWPDVDAVAILRQCRAAMSERAVLCVLEQVAPDSAGLDPDDQFDLAVKDLNMLVLVGGKERTLAEYARLLAAADLEVEGVHRGAACDVIRARPGAR
jgi:hypothetical protein